MFRAISEDIVLLIHFFTVSTPVSSICVLFFCILLKPTNDLVFKALYSRENCEESRLLLINLLNLVLERKDDSITSITYMNPFSVNDDVLEKNIIMDIKVMTEKQEIIAVEMQVIPYETYKMRTVYYEGKLVSKGLERGQDYGNMKKTIVISFVDGILFTEFEKFNSCFRMMESKAHTLLDEKSEELHFVELGKVNLSKPVSDMSPIERYCAFLLRVGDDDADDFIAELIKYDGKGGFIDMTMKALKDISEDEKMRHIAMSREMFMIDQAWREADAHEKGKTEGEAIGKNKTLQENIQKMADYGLDNKQIGEILQLSETEIERILVYDC